MPIKQGTTDPGKRSEAHGRFGQRRTDGNLNSFNQPDLSYVKRGDNNAEDAAAQVRGKLLKGGVLESDMSTIRGEYEIGDPLQNPLKYDYVSIAFFGPNLKPPIDTSSGFYSIDPSKDISRHGKPDEVAREAENATGEETINIDTVLHRYGNMQSDNTENRKQPFQTSLHPRSVRPTITDENVSHSGVAAREQAQEGNEATVDSSHEDFQPRIEQ